MTTNDNSAPVASNFIRQIIDADIRAGKITSEQLQTRFPPEPNGYLHIGHAKSICLNFGLAQHYGGKCNLRFDDTNPVKEDEEFVASIQEDVKWLGFQWDQLFYTSSYFETLFQAALELIAKDLAYVDDLSAEEIRAYRGTLTKPGKPSPHRDRTPEENRELFLQMRNGAFADGSKVLRAKIDMASPNMNLRDPTLYRIRRATHHQTSDAWCVYPMYDFAHALSDAQEGITHSICTLEFEDHRPLYDWCVANVNIPHQTPHQYEFSRLTLQYTVTSKRKLAQLVSDGVVNGWNDPRMPTISGLRRRGYTPASLREFCERIGVTKSDNAIEVAMLEACIREDLDRNAPRAMAVMHPLRVVITTVTQDEELTLANHPKDEAHGKRKVLFSKEIWIDRNDFSLDPPKGYKRLIEGGEVRLRGAYIIRCDRIIYDENNEIVELQASHDPATLGVNPTDRKVKGVIHWVAIKTAVPAQVYLYEQLFSIPFPDREEGSFLDYINPNSLTICSAMLEPHLAQATVGQGYQFEREGYFCRDPQAEPLRFNRTVTLRDSWGK